MRTSSLCAKLFPAAGVLTLATLVVAISALGGCSSSVATSPPGPAPAPLGGSNTAHAIHVFAKQSGGTTRLDFGPATEARWGGTPPLDGKTIGQAAVSTNLGLQGGFGNADGGTPLLEASTVDSPGNDPWSTAWALVWRAVEQCGQEGKSLPFASELPWHGTDPDHVYGTWFMYENGFARGCTDRLQYQQNLVCVADKLGAIADAVGTVTWSPIATYAVGGSLDYAGSGEDGGTVAALRYAEWDIPPQADADRFIVRDLAIHTLAMVPTIDAFSDIPFPSTMTGLPTPATCSQAFAWLANPANAGTGCISEAIGVPVLGATGGATTVPAGTFPVFPPSSVPICDAAGNNNAPTIAQSALDVEAQILRSSGRLLHDLIRRDVYSDLAAASRSSAQAMDPDKGNQIAWGSQGPYGSIAHAARVLLGRWEIGDQADFGTVADPLCQQTPEIELLGGVPGVNPPPFGSELSARVGDRPIRTAGEQTAAQLVERSGIVLPTCQIQDGNTLKQALVAQLLYEEQIQNHLQTPPPATALNAVVAPLSPDEVIFAFKRALRTWRLVTDTPDLTALPDGGVPPADAGADAGAGPCVAVGDATGVVALPAGLLLAMDPYTKKPAIAPSVGSLQGIVVQGGLARSRLATDPMARAGGMTEVSQCPEANGYWTEWGTDGTATMQVTSIDTNSLAQPPGAELPVAVFQDAFHVGQAIERRLNLLRATTSSLSYTDPASVAVGGIAELRSWAGSTIVHAWSQGTNPNVTSLVVRVGGMSYQNDLGIAPSAPLTSIQNAFGFVYGPPWVAECAAHVRPDCPANFDSTYVQLGSNPTDVTAQYASTGVLDNVFQLTVPLVGGVPQFNPPQPRLRARPQTDSRLYMVLLHDPRSTTGHGRVLGTIPVTGRWQLNLAAHTWYWVTDLYGFVDAPMQRELVHDAIDLGKWVGAKPPALGDPSTAQPAGYCVDGVPRDIFVPLDNELISGSTGYEDSWQHYLDLAQQAAQTADGLGQQLIADDLQISENEQAAAEQLANICGDFGALSSVSVQNDGTIAGTDDATTESCLSEPTTDVVFLGGQSQTPGIQGPTDTCNIKATIGCQTSDLPQGCKPSASPPPNTPPSAVQLCKKPALTAAWLGIAQSSGSPPASQGGGGGVTPVCTHLLNNEAPSLRSHFQAQQLLQDLGDPSLGPGALQSVVAQMRMTVDASNNWQVTYGACTPSDPASACSPGGNRILMDSQNAAYWPACIGSGCTNTPSTLLALAWSAVFRDCPSPGNDNPNAALGCDGGGAAAELNMIKWRVIQAMWMMGASAGAVPQGMVTQPIPAMFSDACPSGTPEWDCIANPVIYSIPAGALSYYPGTLVNAPTCPPGMSSCKVLTSQDPRTTAADVQTMGTIFAVNPAFTTFENSSANEVPNWYRAAYTPPPPVHTFWGQGGPGGQPPGTPWHVMTSNDSAVFQQCFSAGATPNPFASSQCGKDSAQAVQVSLAALVGRASGLDGLSCPQNFGPAVSLVPTITADATDPGASQPWWVTVEDVKLGLGWHNYRGGAPEQFVPPNDPLWQTITPEEGRSCGGSSGLTFSLASGGYGGTGTVTWDQSSTQPTGNNWFPGWGQAVAPTCWPPSTRALSFSGLGAAPNGTCGAASLVLQAASLACAPTPTAVDIASLSVQQVPPVNRLSDIPVLEAWLSLAQTSLSAYVGGVYLQEVPTRVVNDFASKTVGSGALGGTKGQAVLTMEQQIQAFPSAWTQIASDVGSINSAIKSASLAITAAGLNESTAEGQLSLQTIQVQAQMAQAVDQFLVTASQAAGSAAGTLGGSLAVIPAAALQALDAVSYGNQETSVLQSLANDAKQVEQNQLAQALAQLGATTAPLWADVQKQLDGLRASVAQIDASGQVVIQAEHQAAYEVAIGTGQDFVNIAGQEVPLPVNTVLRRQASATEQRYQAALTNAKALSYMARRAIEQRIGVTLESLTQQVGPLAAPASWADDICSLQGVNYAALSTAAPATSADGGAVDGGGMGGSADQQAISQFADAWVGDYVSKLRNFVTYYNAQYPSHQGNDTAVLSLRYDLLPPTPQCTVQAPNLLLNSGDLTQFGSPGWVLTPCDPSVSKCLVVAGGYALPASQAGPWGSSAASAGAGASTGITWLTDVAQASTGSGGVTDAGPVVDPTSWPRNLVVQQVQLSAGSYVLSWWDQARDANGNIVWAGAAAPTPYVAEVFDPSWSALAVYDQPPYQPAQVGDGGVPASWSARHELPFTVTNAGTYTVAFGASTPSGGLGGVAIAAVQLEQAANGQPTPYVATTSTTMVPGTDCSMSDSDLRAAFVHNCDNTGVCSYDLSLPLIVDTTALGGDTAIGAKLANGNYNYRHLTLAVNLVGTGVHSCANDPNPNCYGSAYVQYDLQHDATAAGIVGFDGNARAFDFGLASIFHGKALAAERYITMPLSSNDQGLVSQPGIQHIELGGRPLDGTYHLRIWDSPDLNWSALQDIQVILDYDYWSQIQTHTGQSRRGQGSAGRQPRVLGTVRR